MKRRGVVLALAVAIVLAIVGRYVFWPMRTVPPAPTEFVPPRWETARVAPMHVKHVGDKQIACTRCHEDGFGNAPSLATCGASDCHAKQAATAHRGNDTTTTTCLACHVFRGETKAAACIDCHAAPNTTMPAASVHTHHATEGATCTTCHAVHGEKGARTVAADCTSCHANVRAVHGRFDLSADGGADSDLGTHRVDGAALCTSCHGPHRGKDDARAACIGCHVGSGTGTAFAASDASTATHGSRAIAAVVAPQIQPRGRGVAGHESCLTCHASHDATKADVKPCLGCHRDHEGALSTKSHATCTQCHAPHAPAEASSSCAGCHRDRHVLAETTAPSHATCTSCHDAHRAPAPPEAICAKCHGASSRAGTVGHTIEPKHASSAKGDACVGCHTPHPKAANAPLANACATCHTKAKDDRAFHAPAHAASGSRVVCTQCHAPHDFALASVRTGPQSLAVSGVFCAGCHRPQADKVAARSGHAACAKCHGEAHAPKRDLTCATCHRDESATAPKGHQACTGCHDAHSGARPSASPALSGPSGPSGGGAPNSRSGQPTATAAECTSCHTNKRGALHASLPQGCNDCHRAHGPSGVAQPPACTTCHAQKLPGLHAVGAHATNCKSCHAAHDAPRSDRATCTTGCHADRRSHQPEAAVCKGCHLFR